MKQFSDLLPPEDELRRAFTKVLQNLDLVTRHEFDIQTRVLASMRDKLEALQEQISSLENLKPTETLNK